MTKSKNKTFFVLFLISLLDKSENFKYEVFIQSQSHHHLNMQLKFLFLQKIIQLDLDTLIFKPNSYNFTTENYIQIT